MSTVDAIAAALRARIFDGDLQPEERLLERNGGRLPQGVRVAVAGLGRTCAMPSPPWGEVAEAHNVVHLALVEASGSDRIARAYARLRPHWSLERMAAQHERLLDDLETTGPPALRRHLSAGLASVLA